MSHKSILFEVLKKHLEFSAPIFSTVKIGKDHHPCFSTTAFFADQTFIQEGHSSRLKQSQDIVCCQILEFLRKTYNIIGSYSGSSFFNQSYQQHFNRSPLFCYEHIGEDYFVTFIHNNTVVRSLAFSSRAAATESISTFLLEKFDFNSQSIV